MNAPDLGTMERCNLLLKDMVTNPLAEWFLDPVDHVGLELTDYLTVVQTPMDLSTVSKKMERAQYMSSEDFAHDVRLVWQNAIAYNSAQSMFGIVAGVLAQVFDRRFALITRSATADPGRPIPDRPGWPTFQQKKKFYDLCTRLTLADLNQMVSLVQRGCGSAVQQCGDKEVEVRTCGLHAAPPLARRLFSPLLPLQRAHCRSPCPLTVPAHRARSPCPLTVPAHRVPSPRPLRYPRSMSTSSTWRRSIG